MLCNACNNAVMIQCECGGGSSNGCADCFGDGWRECYKCKPTRINLLNIGETLEKLEIVWEFQI